MYLVAVFFKLKQCNLPKVNWPNHIQTKIDQRLLQGWYSQQKISFDILMIILKARKDYLKKTNHYFWGGELAQVSWCSVLAPIDAYGSLIDLWEQRPYF
jgi:hypothetical protein